MFSKNHDDCIASIGETKLIERIRGWLGEVSPPTPGGMGDDCAVLEPIREGLQLLTTDSVTFGQHFDASVRPEDAGAKLIKRNLSDIAAMGGEPEAALLTLICGPDLRLDWLESFVRGIRQCCADYGVFIVGGDVSQLAESHFVATLTLTGTCQNRPILRSTARIGDSIYVTGRLGGSILGKHYRFNPRIHEGKWLASRLEVSAMMDLTDGLGKDLAALLPEASSALIELSELPCSKEAETCASMDRRPTVAHAFCDGEDYELLFTVKAETDESAFLQGWHSRFPHLELTRIGSIIDARSASPYLDAATGKPLSWDHGFEHFTSR